MGHALRISLLGAVVFQVNDQPLSNLTWVKARALLIYLAVTGRPHTRAALAGLLWSDIAENAAHNNLRVTLATLRQVVGDSIVATRQTIALAAGDANTPPIWLDATQFVQACSRLQRADASMEEGEYQALRAAVHLYKGDFLAGFHVPDAELFAEWMVGERAYYGRLALEALTRLAEIALQRHATASGIEDAQRALTFDPLLEKAHQLLMQLYAHSGQSSQALRQYDECVRRLNEELGIAPAEEMVALYEAIRTRTLPKLTPSVVEGGSAQSQHEIGRRPLHNLPHQTTAFVGREVELTALREQMASAHERLVTIVAPGGMGKTRLAQEAALAQVEHFSDGVYFVPLAPLSHVHEVVPAIADAVNYPMQTDQRSPQEQLLDFLRHKELLLVLDNFEHLLDAAQLVTEILQAAGGVKILVTSRERLRLSSEGLLSLGGLALPNEPTAEELASADAVKLFAQYARRITPTFRLNESNGAGVVEICRLTFGMPLGIVLAAAWVSLLTVGEIAAEIRQSLDFLEADLRDLPERQRSLASVFEHTWQRLSPAEQETFMRLATFRNGFNRLAAQVVAGATTRLLLNLADKALIQPSSPGRYEIHELLRQFGLRMLARAGTTDNAYDAHSAYFLHFVSTLESDLKGRRQLAALAELEADLDNVRAAWSWALSNKNYAAIDQSVEAISLFYTVRGRTHEGSQMLWHAYQILIDENAHTLAWRVLVRYGLVQEDIHAHSWSFERARVEAEMRGDQAEIAACWFALGRQEQSAAWAGQRETFDGARGYFEQALFYYRNLNDDYYLARVLGSIGSCYGYAVDTMEQLRAFHTFALESAQRAGSVHNEVQELGVLGWTAVDLNELTVAERFFDDALALSGNLISRSKVAYVVLGVAFVHFLQGRLASAAKMAEEALIIAREVNATWHEGWAYCIQSLVAALSGDSVTALQHGERSVQALGEIHSKAHTHWAYALAQCSVNNQEVAWQYLRTAYHTVQVPSSILRVLAVAAVLLGQQGDHERAVEVFGVVFTSRYSAHAWMEQWRLLTGVRAHLQTELGATAYQTLFERGASLDAKTLADELLGVSSNVGVIG